MILFTFHIVAIATIIAITAHFAFSLGKKNGLRIAEKQEERKDSNKDNHDN